jgi:hypothetical protein
VENVFFSSLLLTISPDRTVGCIMQALISTTWSGIVTFWKERKQTDKKLPREFTKKSTFVKLKCYVCDRKKSDCRKHTEIVKNVGMAARGSRKLLVKGAFMSCVIVSLPKWILIRAQLTW